MVSTSTLTVTTSELDGPLLLVGHDHRISFANTAAHQLLGYPKGGLHGLPLERLVPLARLGELQNLDAVFGGQASRRVRSAVTRADGGTVDVGLTVEPCHDDLGAVVAVSLRYEPIARRSTGPRGLDPHGPRNAESGIRLDPARMAQLVAEQLGDALKLVALLDEHLVRARADQRELGHARGVVNELREILADCELDLGALSPAVVVIPKAPKLPRG